MWEFHTTFLHQADALKEEFKNVQSDERAAFGFEISDAEFLEVKID